MKKNIKDLDIDYIGGQGALTLKEEKALSEFFKQKKLDSKKTSTAKSQRLSKKEKSV